MRYYSDGSEAKIGDRVVGKGNNLPGPICGIVVGVVEDSKACDLRVAYLSQADEHVGRYAKDFALFKDGAAAA
jgi:hypothetical protein